MKRSARANRHRLGPLEWGCSTPPWQRNVGHRLRSAWRISPRSLAHFLLEKNTVGQGWPVASSAWVFFAHRADMGVYPVLPSNRAPSFCHGMPTKSPQIWSPDSSGRGPIGRSTWHGQCLEIFEIIRALQGTSVTPNRDRVRPDGGANDASKGGPFQKMINFSSRKLPNGPPCP